MDKLARLENLQKQIERILSTKPTPREIADEFLKRPKDTEYSHLQAIITHQEAMECCKERFQNTLWSKLQNRNEPEELIYHIYSACKIFELPIMAELGKAHVKGFKGCICSKSSSDKKLIDIKKDITAIDRIVANNPLSNNTLIELSKRKELLQEVLKQGKISISRQQETVLQWLVSLDIDSASLIKDFVLIRDNCPPNEIYKQSLFIIIADLLVKYANHKRRAQISIIQKLVFEIVISLIPKIKSNVTPHAIKYALTGQ